MPKFEKACLIKNSRGRSFLTWNKTPNLSWAEAQISVKRTLVKAKVSYAFCFPIALHHVDNCSRARTWLILTTIITQQDHRSFQQFGPTISYRLPTEFHGWTWNAIKLAMSFEGRASFDKVIGRNYFNFNLPLERIWLPTIAWLPCSSDQLHFAPGRWTSCYDASCGASAWARTWRWIAAHPTGAPLCILYCP